ncbi:MAG: peptide chain release factor N(5)-glutamine methyltransferase [Bacteroidetes bacterium]|nr:peptide chain release factor N(5)-glutamine methyltransferase [Bacteroidota bacterium]
MLTVLESINLSTEYLKNKGIESPRINAELLLAKILNCKRLELYLSFDRPLVENEVTQYREYIKRRSSFEPLQYIIGSVEFYGLEFKVNRSVLIPRQETEILVETIIKEYQNQNGLKILDIGTGSGIIAVCLAKYLPSAKVIAIDSSSEAIKVAKENAELNQLNENITFIDSEFMKYKNENENEFDVIVSNPPYISSDEFQDLQPELRIYEPRQALTDESNGLSFYKTITKKGKLLLKKNGKVFFEVGQNQSLAVKEILVKEHYSEIQIQKDYLSIDRVIYGELD